MTWITNSTTWVECNDPKHEGDPRAMIETGFAMTAREALKTRGWGYDHAHNVHVCPDCVTRNITSRSMVN